MSAPAPADVRTRAAARTRRFRTDIQALRAVAIGLVVLNHLWPDRIPGGYVGVDVFFVISGFLITGHLHSELERTGRVRLASFYARRIRRLLPAALLVLAVTLLGVWWLLPYTRWMDNAVQAISSTLYVENWTLAGLSVNYSAHNAAASAVQHYWSLSVEEQFYLVWPLLLLCVAASVMRWRRSSDRRRVLLVVVAAVAALSFLASILYTASAPAQAYFVTFTRAWQFAVGAVVALIPAALLGRLNVLGASALAAAGFLGIAASAFLFGSETAYPGAVAGIPVLATAAVIVAGTGRRAPLWGISVVTDRKAVQWLGDVSYSLYLWHWPLIILLPFLIAQPLSWWSRLLILAVALLLAGGSRRWIEVPAQRASWWRSAPRAFLGGGAMMAMVAAIGLLLLAGATVRSTALPSPGQQSGPCHGPDALADPGACDPSAQVADPVVTEQDAYFGLAAECGELQERLMFDDRQTTRECDFSRDGETGPRVWLVGDSHAEQWQAAIFPTARAEGWRLTISSFPGCPPADVAFIGFDAPWGPVDYERCRDWAEALSEELLAEKPDLVVTSMAARQQLLDDGSGRSHDEQFIDGLRRTWSRWTDAGIAVVPIADTPLNGDVRDIDCLVLNSESPSACAVPRSAATPPDAVALAAAAPLSDVWPADLTSFLCDDSLCFAAVGGEPVFYDADHLSSAYAAMLGDRLRIVIDSALQRSVVANG
ncbi:peptidoglycan/LPS O-acetylase OafA/YrhL [Microbacterium natoriense]|uniref:Peptidoglycan/LPS O-acetylase OafA/YrhL n=1 Tax=Microbacterium natoriense TaxID=284570 RepID=A0AAW8EY83_9MICO|nr:acyltransferase family protein [Microbacterium natoriense]MDQ0647764.1 peptidoglycan/LPS O-acetylase OafA/YrhL [Microbacterium natoriense]